MKEFLRLPAAVRTRSDGEWQTGGHYSKLELGREVMNSLTRVAKDTLVIEIYELDTTRPESGEEEDTASETPYGRGGEDSDDSPRDGIQEPTTCFHCLRYGRSEEMKMWRRLVGDNGGIKFQGKLAKTRDDGCTNTVTNVSKDNLIQESYERLQRD